MNLSRFPAGGRRAVTAGDVDRRVSICRAGPREAGTRW